MTVRDGPLRRKLSPVLREFGATVFHCQILEDNLCFLLALVREQDQNHKKLSYQAEWNFYSKKTLGFLIKELARLIELQQEDEKCLRRGVALRNSIVHGFLTKNILFLWQPRGRPALIRELVKLRKEIDDCDKLIEQLILSLLAKYGIRSVDLQAAAECYWQRVNTSREQ